MSAFPARFPGRCGACDERIHEGDLIRFSAESATNFIHDDCEDAAPVERPTAPPCGKCFMVPAANGECGCDR